MILGEKFFCFVMEVDVEFLFIKCKNYYFKVDLKNIKNIINKFIENKFVFYLWKGLIIECFVNEKE